jgi:hypothetical protein
MKIALVCIAKNEDNYIDEWIDYHLKLGFDDVVIYRNNWDYDNDNNKVKIINYPGEVKQLSAYNDFITKNIGIYDWAAFFDVDEFLVLKKHSNVKEFISDYKSHDAIAINWVLFGSNGHESVVDENYNILDRFTKRQKTIDIHIKNIVKLQKNIGFNSPHNTNKPWVSPEGKIGGGPFNKFGDDSIAQLNHYFCKSKTEFEQKILRGRSDTKSFRTMSEFSPHDINESEDLSALNFFRK